MSLRLLITASRNWEGAWAERQVHQVLDQFLGLATVLRVKLRVSHGDCPTGGDAITRRWCDRRDGLDNLAHQPFPAEWLKYQQAAGPIRNKYMVERGHDICVGFNRNNSRGTMGCMDLARQAGIPVFEIKWTPEEP